MKNKIVVFLIFGFVGLLMAQDPYMGVRYRPIDPGETNYLAQATNNTKGAAIPLPGLINGVFLTVKASGGAATTNGTATWYFEVSPDNGSNFTSAAQSYIKLSTTSIGNTNVTITDWFNLAGYNKIRLGRVETSFLGGISNTTITASWPSTPEKPR